jgi:hypothetical protein
MAWDVLGKKHSPLINPTVLQAFEYFATSHAVLQEFFRSAFHIAPKSLLTEGASL